MIIFLRVFDSYQYGQYSLIFSQCNLIGALCFGWINQAQIRYYSSDKNDYNYKNFQIAALIFSSISSLIILSIFVLLQSISYKIYLLSLFIIVITGFFNFFKANYQAKIEPINVMLLTIGQSILSLFFPLILLLFKFRNNEETLLFGVSLSFLFGIVVMIIKNNHRIRFSYIQKKIVVKGKTFLLKWFKYGSPISIWLSLGLAFHFLDRFFINQYLANYELGVYAGVQELITRSFSLTLFPIILSIHPRLMILWNKSYYDKVRDLMIFSLRLVLLLGMFIFFIIWQFDKYIFLLIESAIPQFNYKYKELILPLFAAGFLWQLSLLTHKMLELKEKTKFMVIALIPSLIINIIGNIIFLPKMGLVATAYTALFSSLLYCIITGIHCIKNINKLKFI